VAEWFDALTAWLSHEGWLAWLTGLSALMFFGSIAALPFLAALIPQDYFTEAARQRSRTHSLHPVLYYAIRVLKNLLALLLILAGLAMLVLPGQGLLTLLIGIVLSDFPGKYRLERKLVRRDAVFRAINWLRQRRGQPPLLRPDAD
jgi:archaellum biogenesis protein FlaJ (TadC family)